MDDEYCEVELSDGVIVKAKLGTGMTPKNLSKSGDRVPIEKQGVLTMSTTDLQKRIDELIEKAQRDAEQALARVDAKIRASRPAPSPSKPQLSGLSFPELQAMTRAGTLSLNDFNIEMDVRRKNPRVHQVVKESTEHANDLVTAARLAALVKEKYMAERATEKRELIIKTALDESLARMDAAEAELMQSSLSQADRREIQARFDSESEFQEQLLGSPQAVGEFYLETVNRPRPTLEAQAAANLQTLARGEGEVAAELRGYFEETAAANQTARVRDKKRSWLVSTRPASELRAG